MTARPALDAGRNGGPGLAARGTGAGSVSGSRPETERRGSPRIAVQILASDSVALAYLACHGLGRASVRPSFPEFDHDAAPSSPGVVRAAVSLPGLRIGGRLCPPGAGRRQPHSREHFGQRLPGIGSAHARLQFASLRLVSGKTRRRDSRKLTAPVVSLRHEHGADRWNRAYQREVQL
jgi:hypothetical protein